MIYAYDPRNDAILEHISVYPVRGVSVHTSTFTTPGPLMFLRSVRACRYCASTQRGETQDELIRKVSLPQPYFDLFQKAFADERTMRKRTTPKKMLRKKTNAMHLLQKFAPFLWIEGCMVYN